MAYKLTSSCSAMGFRKSYFTTVPVGCIIYYLDYPSVILFSNTLNSKSSTNSSLSSVLVSATAFLRINVRFLNLSNTFSLSDDSATFTSFFWNRKTDIENAPLRAWLSLFNNLFSRFSIFIHDWSVQKSSIKTFKRGILRNFLYDDILPGLLSYQLLRLSLFYLVHWLYPI